LVQPDNITCPSGVKIEKKLQIYQTVDVKSTNGLNHQTAAIKTNHPYWYGVLADFHCAGMFMYLFICDPLFLG
jgi:hypothetical protein